MPYPQTADKSAVETAIDNAKESCESGTTGECAAAWDEVICLPLLIHSPVRIASSSAVHLFCRDADCLSQRLRSHDPVHDHLTVTACERMLPLALRPCCLVLFQSDQRALTSLGVRRPQVEELSADVAHRKQAKVRASIITHQSFVTWLAPYAVESRGGSPCQARKAAPTCHALCKCSACFLTLSAHDGTLIYMSRGAGRQRRPSGCVLRGQPGRG